MSHVFSIPVALDQLPPIAQFLNEISSAWLELVGPDVGPSEAVQLVSPTWDEQEGEEWLEDTSYLFYLTNISTRGLEVWYKDGRFYVRVLSFSCQHEFELALDMLVMAGQYDDVLVHLDAPESEVPLGELHEVFDDQWIATVIAEHLEKTLAALAEGHEVLEFGGPVRTFYFGPWVAMRLFSVFPDLEEQYGDIIELIFDMMRFVQYFLVRPEFVDVKLAENVTWTGTLGAKNGALLTADCSLFFQEADNLVLPHPKEGFLVLPAANIKEELQPILEDVTEVYWLDEIQFVIFPLDKARLADIAEQIGPACKRIKKCQTLPRA